MSANTTKNNPRTGWAYTQDRTPKPINAKNGILFNVEFTYRQVVYRYDTVYSSNTIAYYYQNSSDDEAYPRIASRMNTF